jgi:hypothetical protein
MVCVPELEPLDFREDDLLDFERRGLELGRGVTVLLVAVEGAREECFFSKTHKPMM